MSASTIITLGFGSFGNAKYLPTLGYDTSGSPPPPPPVQTTVVGGSGKDRRNEIVEINGIRWSVPKDQVAEFLAQFQPKHAPVVVVQAEASSPTVSFTTPSGKVVTTTEQTLKDDIGVILVMCALADEDFYED